MKTLSRCATAITVFVSCLVLLADCVLGAETPAKPAEKTPVVPAAATQAVNPKLDPALKKQLDELKFKYDVNPEGTCRLLFTFGKDRSHQVYVTSKKESFMGVEYRRVWATALKSKEVPSAEILTKLLQDSVGKKIGAWELQHWSDGYRAIFAAKLPSDCSNPALQAAIKLVANGADFMEEELTAGKDDF